MILEFFLCIDFNPGLWIRVFFARFSFQNMVSGLKINIEFELFLQFLLTRDVIIKY